MKSTSNRDLLSRFKVELDGDGFFFMVKVWKNATALRKNTGATRALGLCRSLGEGKRLGEIHLCGGHLGVGIVSHECAHAVIRWASETGCHVPWRNLGAQAASGSFLKASSPEERFCWVMGSLVCQIYNELYDRKLLLEAGRESQKQQS